MLRDILESNGITLVVSGYHDNVLLAISQVDIQAIPLLRPMGISVFGDSIAIGTATNVIEYRNMPGLNEFVIRPVKKEDAAAIYDSDKWYIPKMSITTGGIDIHDIAHDHQGNILMVNTRFSCLSKLDLTYSFNPVWWPSFVSEIAPQDRCHLNGLAMRDGKPFVLSAFAETDEPVGWRKATRNNGILIDYETNSIVFDGLDMPHSPRWYQDKLYFLNSAKGELNVIEDSGPRAITHVSGFSRGLSFYKDWAFVGVSEPRHVTIKSGLDVRKLSIENNNFSSSKGIAVIDLKEERQVDFLPLDVKEIFDVEVLESKRPAFLSPSNPLINHLFILPETAKDNIAGGYNA